MACIKKAKFRMIVSVVPSAIPGLGAPEVVYTDGMNMTINTIEPGDATTPAVYEYVSNHRIDFIKFKNPDISNLKTVTIEYGKYLKSIADFAVGSPTLESFAFRGWCNIEDYSRAFMNCTALTDPGLWDQVKAKLFTSTWEGCTAIHYFPPTNMLNATDFNSTWKNCTSMECMENLDTTSSSDGTDMFLNCTALLQPNTDEQALLAGDGYNWKNAGQCAPGRRIIILEQQTDRFNLTDYVSKITQSRQDVIVINYLKQPTMVIGDMGEGAGLPWEADFYNFGEFQGVDSPVDGIPESGVGIEVTPTTTQTLVMYNNGAIKGAGSNGGKGADGAKGNDGADSLPKVVYWVDPKAQYVAAKTGYVKLCPGPDWISVGDGWYFRNKYTVTSCDGSFLIDPAVKGPCGTEMDLTIGEWVDICGTRARLLVTMNTDGANAYEIEGGYISETKSYTIPGAKGGKGGAGGIGGAGGTGETFGNPPADGEPGTPGEPGEPGTANTWVDPNGDTHVGNKSGDGEDGQPGCSGGKGGSFGNRGMRGECLGEMPIGAGYSIYRYNLLDIRYMGDIYGSLVKG